MGELAGLGVVMCRPVAGKAAVSERHPPASPRVAAVVVSERHPCASPRVEERWQVKELLTGPDACQERWGWALFPPLPVP